MSDRIPQVLVAVLELRARLAAFEGLCATGVPAEDGGPRPVTSRELLHRHRRSLARACPFELDSGATMVIRA